MLKLRPADVNDVELILNYIRELADYERAPAAVVATIADLRRFLFGEKAVAHAVLAEWQGQAAGFALYFFSFSTWEGKPGLYLEDLWVRPAFRKLGIGKALFRHLARVAVENDCTRYVWQVLDWNTPSLEFYQAQGAQLLREWLTFRLEGNALQKLAQLDSPWAGGVDKG